MISIASEIKQQDLEFTSVLEARLCAIVLTANGKTKKNKKVFETSDFLPPKIIPKKKKRALTIEQHKEIMRAAVLKAGGTVNTS